MHARCSEGGARSEERKGAKGDGNRVGEGTGTGTMMRTGMGTGTGAETTEGMQDGNRKWNGDANDNGGSGELWNSPHQERSRVEDQALPFRTRHYLCRHWVAPTGSQQLRMQDPATF